MAMVLGNMSGRGSSSSSPLDYHCKLMTNRADNTGKHFSYFAQTLFAYARKQASLRDKGDDLVDIITSFGNTETYNTAGKQQLQEFSHWLALIQDLRHLAATRTSAKIVPGFRKYEDTVKSLKADVRKCQTFNEKVKTSLEAVEKARLRNGDASALHHTMQETYRLNTTEAAQQGQILRLHGKEFEEGKLRTIQTLLLDFVRSEMMFHCKAIEIYSAASRSLQNWVVEGDLNEFLQAYDAVSIPVPETVELKRSITESAAPSGDRDHSARLRESVSQPNLTGNIGDRDPVAFDYGIFRAQSTGGGVNNERAPRPQAAAGTANRRVPMEDSESD